MLRMVSGIVGVRVEESVLSFALVHVIGALSGLEVCEESGDR